MGSTAFLFLALAVTLDSVASPAAQERGCGPTLYECAASQVQRGELHAAIASLQQLLTRTPADLKALNLLGIALTEAGKPDEANARFREALRIDPRFYPALKNLAVNELNHGQVAAARRDFEAVLAQVPDDAIAHLHLGEIEFAANNCRLALTHYEKSATRIAQNAAWTLRYATCLAEAHQTANAVTVLDQLPDGDGQSRFEAGVILGRAAAHREAARMFGSARKAYKDPYTAGYNQTLMLIEAGDYDGAIRVAEEMVAEGTKAAELYNLVSRAYLKKERIKDAYDALRIATRIEPTAEENYVDLASICLDHQNYDLALEIIDIGIRYRPVSSMLHLQRAVVLATRADLGPAEQAFDAARRLAPDQPGAYAGLAMIWMQTGQTEKAVDVLRDQVRRVQADHVIPYMFAVALMRSGLDPAGAEASEAVDALTVSLRAKADFAPSHSELGRIFLKRDNLDGAIRELEIAIALDPESTAAIYNLAQAYRKKGDRTRAGELLSRLSAMNAQERDDSSGELKRAVIRIVREGSLSKP
jgi:tetratricopeptide (TPR) repeat protein